jgi:hypothetical protein
LIDIILFKKTARLLDDDHDGDDFEASQTKSSLTGSPFAASSYGLVVNGFDGGAPAQERNEKSILDCQRLAPLRGLGKNVNTAKVYEPPPDLKATMTKVELSDWKKEQRKLRNRASASVNRDKMLNRVEVLEAEVDINY